VSGYHTDKSWTVGAGERGPSEELPPNWIYVSREDPLYDTIANECGCDGDVWYCVTDRRYQMRDGSDLVIAKGQLRD
jgi:hypothetical protein